MIYLEREDGSKRLKSKVNGDEIRVFSGRGDTAMWQVGWGHF